MENHMKKGQTYTGIVERVDFPNKGIVIVDTVLEDGTIKKRTLCGKKHSSGAESFLYGK